MCGINGLLDFTSPPKEGRRLVDSMNHALAHRGPDGAGIYESKDARVVLGSRRLSIVDRERGAMPMTAVHGGAEYAIVSNAEIFNHAALRSELMRKYAFATLSDTEVVLYAYIEWGEACVEHLRGQFAFIIYDGARELAFFARDRLGIKPLYYARIGAGLAISSEPKGILAHPDVVRRPDRTAIADYFLGILALGKSEPLDRSFFEGIRALLPGAYGTFDASGFKTCIYHEPAFKRVRAPDMQLARALRHEVERATREQIPEEVPYGLLLSGGLDSSILAVLASRHQKPPAAAAVLRYEGVENPDYGYARLLAERQGIELIAPAVSDELLTQHVDALVCALDRPYDSVRELGLFEMYRSLRARELPVALVGEGADEFNLGYYHVLPGFAKGGDRCATAAGFREVLYERSRDVARYFSAAFIDEGLVSSVIEHNVREYYDRADIPDPLDRMEYYYIRKFLKGRLDMHDRLAMANSIETRVPYCDDDVVMASLAVPPELNLSGGTEKAILRKAFADILPESIAHRRKYALSESTDTVLYRTILRSFDAELAKADDAIWDILDKRYAVELRTIAEERISAAERDTLHDHELTAGTPLGEPLAFRIRHLFVLLTFLRWYDLYFVGT